MENEQMVRLGKKQGRCGIINKGKRRMCFEEE